MSERKPLNDGARSRPSLVHSRNSTTATSSGRTQRASSSSRRGQARPGWRTATGPIASSASRRCRSARVRSVKPRADLSRVAQRARLVVHADQQRSELPGPAVPPRLPAGDDHVLAPAERRLDPAAPSAAPARRAGSSAWRRRPRALARGRSRTTSAAVTSERAQRRRHLHRQRFEQGPALLVAEVHGVVTALGEDVEGEERHRGRAARAGAPGPSSFTAMRLCSAPKDGRPSGPKATISPSRRSSLCPDAVEQVARERDDLGIGPGDVAAGARVDADAAVGPGRGC